MEQKNTAKKNIERVCSELMEVRQYLLDTALAMKDDNTKHLIEKEMNSINNCLCECQNISNRIK